MIKIKQIFSLFIILALLSLCLNMVFPSFAEGQGEGRTTSQKTDTTGTTGTTENDPVIPEPEKKGGYFKLTQSIRLLGEFELVLALSCDPANIVNGFVSYNSELLKFEKLTPLAENWQMSQTDSDGVLGIIAADFTLENPIELDTELCSLTFSLTENAKENDILEFSFFNITAENIEGGGFSVEGSSLNAAVERTLSSNAQLGALSVNGGELTPAFSPEIKEYGVTLPYSCENAEIEFSADEFAKVELSDTALKVGENTVKVAVTSEDATSSAEYILKITRERSPDYVESNDSKIASLIVEGGALSGEFSPEKLQYVIYIASSTQRIKLIPTASSPLANASELVIDCAYMGTHKLVCTAENGETSEYIFTLKTVIEADTVHGSTDGTQPASPNTGALLSGNKALVLGIIIMLIVSVTTFFVGYIIPKKGSETKKKRAVPKENSAGSEEKL